MYLVWESHDRRIGVWWRHVFSSFLDAFGLLDSRLMGDTFTIATGGTIYDAGERYCATPVIKVERLVKF
jgi:hypothetical protein